MKWHIRILFAFLLVMFCARPVLAQSDRASITGDVTDPQGKPVPGAKVTVKNVDTGATFETTTAKDTGRYVTPAILKPGRYTVQVEKEGFKTAVSQVVTLEIGDVKVVDLSLALGAVSQTVTVEANAPLLDTETSELGEVVTGRQITDLPLKDRNFTQLATLTPGVVRATVGVLTDATAFNQGDARFGQGDVTGSSNTQGSTEASRFSRSGGASISVNGLRPTNNNFSLDGVDNNEPQFGTIGVYPNPDAIQEFKVETGNFKAENGRGGAVINTTYQSGTNALHGSLYYYGQNDFLNATAWGIGRLRNDSVAAGLTPQQAKQQNPESRIRINEFGFTVGGPIIKDKTFFFGDFLGQRNATPNAFETVVPTAKTRIGDFSEFTSPVIDPQTCATPGNVASGGCSSFPGNVISNLQTQPNFSQQAFKLFALYPLPTVPNVTDPNNSTGHFNFFGTRNNTERINAFDIKLDHKLTNRNSLIGRFSRSNQEVDRANFFPKVPTAGFGAGNEIGNTRQVVVEDTHMFKPTLLNDLRFGWTHVEIGIKNCGVEGACGISPTACQDLGIPNCNHGTPASTGGILTGGFGTGFFEFTGDGGLFLVKSNNFYVGDTVTIISGNHTWKAGLEVRPRLLDTIDGGRSGGLKGQLQYGAGTGQSTGNVQADYLLGRPAVNASNGAIAGGDNPFQLRTAEWGMFLQDDWKASSNLTFNLGVRYDLFPPWREASGRMADFNPLTGQIIVAKGSGDRIISTATHNIGPRLGFAYNFGPQKRMVLRGGYGIFYTEDGYDYPPVIRNPPLTASSAGNGEGFLGGTANFNLTTGPPCALDFSVPTPSCPAVTLGAAPVVTPSSTLFTQELKQKVGMIQEINLTGEWEFARNWLFDLGYAGSRSHHLLATRELGNNTGGLGLAQASTGPIGSDIAYENRASANYDSLQASVLKRFSQGFLFRGSYTWSHNIDDSTGVFQGLGESRGTSGGPVDPLNFGLDRGTSSLDRRQVFVANAVWDLPIGKGKRLAGNTGSILDKVIGGWQFNSIWSAESGQPFDVTVGGTNNPTGAVRPNLICNPLSGRSGATADSFFNVSCFQIPQFVTQTCGGKTVNVGAAAPAGSVRNLSGLVDPCGNVGSLVVFGNEGRNVFVGPGLFKADLSLFKNTQFGERYRLQFGIEFFNAFNSVNLIVPNNTLTNGDFNRFDSSYPPRQIQYRMKFIF
jgi:carboxypeptidase family protein/TonB-dependent receptor-like protein